MSDDTVHERDDDLDDDYEDDDYDDEIAPEGNRIIGARARAVVEHVTRNVAEEPDAVEIDVTERRNDVQCIPNCRHERGGVAARPNHQREPLRTLGERSIDRRQILFGE